jgi:hypothetical protein
MRGEKGLADYTMQGALGILEAKAANLYSVELFEQCGTDQRCFELL